MKILVALSAVPLLVGCTSPGHNAAPTRLADGAATGMWTARPAGEVRACVDDVLARTPSRYRYEVAANDPRETSMATTVSGFTDGNADPVGATIAAACLPTR